VSAYYRFSPCHCWYVIQVERAVAGLCSFPAIPFEFAPLSSASKKNAIKMKKTIDSSNNGFKMTRVPQQKP